MSQIDDLIEAVKQFLREQSAPIPDIAMRRVRLEQLRVAYCRVERKEQADE